MYFITTKRMLEVCFSAHPNIQYRTRIKSSYNGNKNSGNKLKKNPRAGPAWGFFLQHVTNLHPD